MYVNEFKNRSCFKYRSNCSSHSTVCDRSFSSNSNTSLPLRWVPSRLRIPPLRLWFPPLRLRISGFWLWRLRWLLLLISRRAHTSWIANTPSFFYSVFDILRSEVSRSVGKYLASHPSWLRKQRSQWNRSYPSKNHVFVVKRGRSEDDESPDSGYVTLRNTIVTRTTASRDPRSNPRAFDPLKSNMSLQSGHFQFAVSFAVIGAIGLLIAQGLGLIRGYWVLITVCVLLLRSDILVTFSFTAMLIIGTIGGAVIGSIIIANVHSMWLLLYLFVFTML
jgi:hypothetical protein